MMRFVTFLSLIFLAVVGGFLFHVKYQVVEMEGRLKATNRQILQVQEAIQVLKAEWAYLNKPDRLKELATRYLNIKPPETEQMAFVFFVSEEKKVK